MCGIGCWIIICCELVVGCLFLGGVRISVKVECDFGCSDIVGCVVVWWDIFDFNGCVGK